MKSILLVGLLGLISLPTWAQSTQFQKNNEWLETQLNTLLGPEDKKEVQFRFADCDARMEAKTTGEGTNFSFSVGCQMADIEKVSYKKDGKEYTIQLALKDKSKDEEMEDISFSLATTDEKMIKEIKRRLEANIAECKSLRK